MGVVKSGVVKFVVLLALVALPRVAQAGEWFHCGNLGQLSACQLQAYPATKYEYGIAYNTSWPVSVTCSGWNVGWRIYNTAPYFVVSDNPSANMLWGGFMFYTGTHATDDDECLSGTWRHRYWSLGANNAVTPFWGNGCINMPIYCRSR